MGAKRKSASGSGKATVQENVEADVSRESPPPPPPPPHGIRRRTKTKPEADDPPPVNADDDDDHADVHSEEAGAESSSVGRNAFERRLCTAILEAADSTCLEEARAGLHVVSVGRFAKTDQRACACGQKPLQRVFHLRHKGTGKQLDIGAACAKKFKMLGAVETEEAERALRNLEHLQQDPEAEMRADLCKLARANGLLVRTETEVIRKAQPHDQRYIDELKAIVLSGLSFVRLDLQGVKDELSTPPRPTKADRCAILRLAILSDRRSLLGAIDMNTVNTRDLYLGKDVEKHPEQSLVGEAVKLGFCQEAKMLLDVVGWDGPHARGALLQGIRKENVTFIRDYLDQLGAAPPEKQVARSTVQLENPRVLQILLEWCSSKKREEVEVFLDEALVAACDNAPENTITQLVSANARDKEGCALIRWCARCAKDTELPLEVSGAGIAEDLIVKAGASPDSHCRLLERACIHFAAAAGDVNLVRLLLKHGACVWDCTSAPHRSEIKCSELKKGGLGSLGRQLPVEVAQGSNRDTSEVEEALKSRMAEDLALVSSGGFSPLPRWLEKDLDSIRRRYLGEGGADYKILCRFASYVTRLRRDPESCKREADERRRYEEQMREMEEKARKEAEEYRLKVEQERLEREEEHRTKMEERRRLLEEQRRAAEEQERTRLEEQLKREEEERRENLIYVCEEGTQRLGLGCYRGMTFEGLACKDPTYLRRVADGHLKGPEAFLQFAKLRMRFLRDEVVNALKHLAEGRDVLHDEATKKEEWTEMRKAKRNAEVASRRKDRQQEALDMVCKSWDWTLGGKGKYAGTTYSEVAKDRDYAEWWLNRGPGKDSSFGKFVAARNNLSMSVAEIEMERKKRASSEAANAQVATNEDFASLRASQLKDELSLRGIAIPTHVLEKEELVQLLQGAVSAASASSSSPSKRRSSVSRAATSSINPQKREALAFLIGRSEKCFSKGKHSGVTYIKVVTDHRNYAEWWLAKGPGADTDFGRFASKWFEFDVTPSELEEVALERLNTEMNVPEDVSDSEKPAKQTRMNTSTLIGSDATTETNIIDGQAASSATFSPRPLPLADPSSEAVPDIDTTTLQTQKAERSPEREQALAFLANQSEKLFARGKYAGQTYLSVVTGQRDYAEWWLAKGPGAENDFGQFASKWFEFNVTPSELAETASEKIDIVTKVPEDDSANEKPAKQARMNTSNLMVSEATTETNIIDGNAASSTHCSPRPLHLADPGIEAVPDIETTTPQNLNAERSPDRKEAMAFLANQSEKLFARGKYIGQNYLRVVTDHWDYADWWLRKGPGEDNEFGKFASTWQRLNVSLAHIVQAQSSGDVGARKRESAMATQVARSPKQLRKDFDVCAESIAVPKSDRSTVAPPTAQPLNSANVEGTSEEKVEMPETRDISAEEMQQYPGASLSSHTADADEEDDDDDALLLACHEFEAARSSLPDLPAASSASLPQTEATQDSESDDDAMLSACTKFEETQRINQDPLGQAASHAQSPSSELFAMPQQSGSTKFTFGKHRGRSFDDIFKTEPSYCKWALEQSAPGENLKCFINWLKSQPK